MAKYEVAPNARYHALQVEGFTLDCDQDCMQASHLRSHHSHQLSHYRTERCMSYRSRASVLPRGPGRGLHFRRQPGLHAGKAPKHTQKCSEKCPFTKESDLPRAPGQGLHPERRPRLPKKLQRQPQNDVKQMQFMLHRARCCTVSSVRSWYACQLSGTAFNRVSCMKRQDNKRSAPVFGFRKRSAPSRTWRSCRCLLQHATQRHSERN